MEFYAVSAMNSHFVRLTTSLFLAFAVAGPAHAWTAVVNDSREERYIKRPDGSKLGYYFMAPSQDSFPLLLYLDGSGCGSAEGWMAYFAPFVEAGFGAALTEKRGVKMGDTGERCSKEYLRTNDGPYRIADAKRILAKGRKLFRGWNGKLVVIGASEGAALAPEVGFSYPKTAAVVSLAGGGWAQGDELKKMLEKELRAEGAGPERISGELSRLDEEFEEIRREPIWSKSFQGKGNTYKRWASFLWYAPVDYLEKLKVPVYVAQGTTDTSSPVESSDAIRDRFLKMKKKNLVYKRYEGLDHGWADAKGTHHDQEVLEELRNWLISLPGLLPK